MQFCDIHFHHNHHWRYCTIHYRFEADLEIGIPAPSTAVAKHGVWAYQKVPEASRNIHAVFRHSFSPQPSLEVLYNPLPLRSRPGNRHSRTIGSCCKTLSMGLPKGPRGIEEHTCSVAKFIFTTTITGGTVQSTIASKQTWKSAFPHHQQQLQNMGYGLTKWSQRHRGTYMQHYKDAGTEFRNEKRMKKELISQRKRMKTD